MCKLDVCDPRCIPKKLRPCWVNVSLVSHFLTFGIVFVAFEMSVLLLFVSMWLLRLCTKPSCCIEVRGIAGQYGV